ncbi:MAG TPA: response regulator transcription factor [Galbitalea sp.]
MTQPIRVVLVDDQSLVRNGFRMILESEDDIEIVGEAADGERAVELVLEVAPDVVAMDVQMPILDGLAATRRIIELESTARVLILTTFDRDDYLFEALTAGASGFLLKNASPEALIEAIRVLARGDALLAPEVTRRVIQRFAGHEVRPVTASDTEALTDRERDVVALVAQGLTNAEVAVNLHVGEATVKTHVSHVLRKLGLRDRTQLVIWAYESGVRGPY